MRCFICALTLWLAVVAATAHAQTVDRLRTFADCAGRLSAVMEYQWMFDGAASEQTKAQRAAVIELIEAIMPQDAGRQVLHWRITAKQAQSALLTRATFNDDPGDAAWAMQTAERFRAECTSMLLS
ncbi:hypothetical protein [Yoonia sediminilitoris]|nr:hypothetical protein [Yoonia sediminilitoris]